MFLAPKFFGGEHPEFLKSIYKTQPDSDHVAKFQGDRSRDLGESVANKKRENVTGKTEARPELIVPGGLINSLNSRVRVESDVTDIRNSSSCVCCRCRPSSEPQSPQCRSSIAASAVYPVSRTGAGGTDGRTVDRLKCFNKYYYTRYLITLARFRLPVSSRGRERLLHRERLYHAAWGGILMMKGDFIMG